MTELSQFSHSIDIAAPPRVVFTFLTTEEGMTAWMGQFAELDPRQGGRFAVDISGYPVRGQYLPVFLLPCCLSIVSTRLSSGWIRGKRRPAAGRIHRRVPTHRDRGRHSGRDHPFGFAR